MDIGEVSARSGLASSTLRYYEEQGLIAPIGRHGLRRQYDGNILERLALITLGRAAGFSLREIKTVFSPAGNIEIDREMLDAKADELDTLIGQLKGMRDGLRHAAKCPEERHMDCPSFRRILKAASIGVIKPNAQMF